MASLFNKNTEPRQNTNPAVLINRYRSSRHNLLSVTIFSLINIVLLATNSGYYFLFSAYVPYMLVDLGMYYCGLYPAEYYLEFSHGVEFADNTLMIICAVIVAVILLLYLSFLSVAYLSSFSIKEARHP